MEMKSLFAAAIELSRADQNALPIFVKTTKMVEEAGELCEAALQNHGYVAADKVGVGTVMEECADMMFQVLDILQSEYPRLSTVELFDHFEQMLERKLRKWVSKKMDVPEGMVESLLGLDSCEEFAAACGALGEPKQDQIVYPVLIRDRWYNTVVDDNGEQHFVGIGPVRALFAHQDLMFKTYGFNSPNCFGGRDVAKLAVMEDWDQFYILEGSILAGKPAGAVIRVARDYGYEVENSFTRPLERDINTDYARSLPQGNPDDPQVGDHFAVRIGNKWYDTVIDDHNVQRFVVQPVVNAFVDHSHKMFDEYWMKQRIADHPAVYGLNEIAVDFARHEWPLSEQIEFYTMFGYSVAGFCDMSWVANVEIDNPLWED